MKNIILWKRIKPVIFTLLIVCFATISHAQIAIVVNKNNPVDDISMSDLKQIYLGKKTTFPDRKTIVLIEYAELKESFYDILFDWSIKKMKKHWMSLIFSGTSSSAPKEIKQPGELKEFLQRNENAIAFINATDADSSVKLLTINGENPTSQKYPIHK